MALKNLLILLRSFQIYNGILLMLSLLLVQYSSDLVELTTNDNDLYENNNIEDIWLEFIFSCKSTNDFTDLSKQSNNLFYYCPSKHLIMIIYMTETHISIIQSYTC